MGRTRSTPFKSRGPRVFDSGPPDVLSKLAPGFVQLASAIRDWKAPQNAGDSEVLSRPPVIALPGWPSTVGEMNRFLSQSPDRQIAQVSGELNAQVPEDVQKIDLDEGIYNLLSLVKYQKTFVELQWLEKRGDKRSSRQIVEVMDLRNRWLHEQLPSPGMRSKTNQRHNLLMLGGMAGGFEKLTSAEVVHFFDQMCSCGEIHDQLVLRRLQIKLLRSIERGRVCLERLRITSPSHSVSL